MESKKRLPNDFISTLDLFITPSLWRLVVANANHFRWREVMITNFFFALWIGVGSKTRLYYGCLPPICSDNEEHYAFSQFIVVLLIFVERYCAVLRLIFFVHALVKGCFWSDDLYQVYVIDSQACMKDWWLLNISQWAKCASIKLKTILKLWNWTLPTVKTQQKWFYGARFALEVLGGTKFLRAL